MSAMIGSLVRGTAQLIAAASGLLFLLGYIHLWGGFFLASTTLQAAEAVAFILPWTLLLCSAFHDLSIAFRREWIFWVGMLLVYGVFILICRYDPNTIATRAGLPALACAGATIPHILRRLSFIYSALCIVTALVGAYALYVFVRTFSLDLYAHDPAAAVYQLLFSVASIVGGWSTVARLFYRVKSQEAANR